MRRTGVMAPPTLYEQPEAAALMAPAPGAVAYDPSPRLVLWVIAGVLAAVELAVAAFNA
jgi:hypothetical protein